MEQVEGLPAHYTAQGRGPSPVDRLPAVEAFTAATGATIQHGGNRAFYAPSRDLVQMPPRESFRDAESYAATLVHELTHWTATRHAWRVNLGKRFGDQAYAAEELIAEMGSAFLCADLASARKCAKTMRLPRPLARRAQEGQSRDLYRRVAGAARRGLPPQLQPDRSRWQRRNRAPRSGGALSSRRFYCCVLAFGSAGVL